MFLQRLTDRASDDYLNAQVIPNTLSLQFLLDAPVSLEEQKQLLEVWYTAAKSLPTTSESFHTPDQLIKQQVQQLEFALDNPHSLKQVQAALSKLLSEVQTIKVQSESEGEQEEIILLEDFKNNLQNNRSLFKNQLFAETLKQKAETNKERFWMFPNFQEESKYLEEASESLSIMQEILAEYVKDYPNPKLPKIEFGSVLQSLESNLETVSDSSLLPSTQYCFDRQIEKSLRFWKQTVDVNLADIKQVEEKALRTTLSQMRKVWLDMKLNKKNPREKVVVYLNTQERCVATHRQSDIHLQQLQLLPLSLPLPLDQVEFISLADSPDYIQNRLQPFVVAAEEGFLDLLNQVRCE